MDPMGMFCRYWRFKCVCCVFFNDWFHIMFLMLERKQSWNFGVCNTIYNRLYVFMFETWFGISGILSKPLGGQILFDLLPQATPLKKKVVFSAEFLHMTLANGLVFIGDLHDFLPPGDFHDFLPPGDSPFLGNKNHSLKLPMFAPESLSLFFEVFVAKRKALDSCELLVFGGYKVGPKSPVIRGAHKHGV